VSGDVLVGSRRFQLDGSGVRIHLWGDQSWAGPWSWAAGRLDDGTSFTAAGDDALTGVVADAGPEGLLRTASVRAGSTVELSAATVAHAPVLVPGPGRLDRVFCRYSAPDGRQGHGWAERLL
jgi:hypothetical protein